MATRREVELGSIAAEVARLQIGLSHAEQLWAAGITQVDPGNRASAVNLAHYWAVRQNDLRGVQRQLATQGLSSLGRSEPHVQASLNAIAKALEALEEDPTPACAAVVGFDEGDRLLRRRTTDLFGRRSSPRTTRIMVTLPTEAASDDGLVRGLIERGMDIARINCAHDDSTAWVAMAHNVRAAAADLGRECRVAMDLAGPKLRTGPLAPRPGVIKLRPRHDVDGELLEPARCVLVPDGETADPDAIPVDTAWLARLHVGDTVTFHDPQGSLRALHVASGAHPGLSATCTDVTYLRAGTELEAPDGTTTKIGPLPAMSQYLTLRIGDELLLTRDSTPASVVIGAPRIGCTLPDVFGHVRPGEIVRLDDGKITGQVVDATADRIRVLITAAASKGTKLRAEKGINLPESDLAVAAVTDADREHLRFVAEQADLVELSFVRSPTDVEDLLAALADLGDTRLGIVLKIETLAGFKRLPEILLTALRRRRVGVMIARGDLAVECGYERLAELQEEILWLCEAAHVPVIWATQVLDRMARGGQPSRAEVTDAAMGERAECVMLNKGPHILDAVTVLDDILTRMAAHQRKKTALLRPLMSWQYGPAQRNHRRQPADT